LGEISATGVAVNAQEKAIGSIDEKLLRGSDNTKAVFFSVKLASFEVADGINHNVLIIYYNI